MSIPEIISDNYGALTVNKRKKEPSPFDPNHPHLQGSTVVPPWSLKCDACKNVIVPTASEKVPKHCNKCGWKLRVAQQNEDVHQGKRKLAVGSNKLGVNGEPIVETKPEPEVPPEDLSEFMEYANKLTEDELSEFILKGFTDDE